MDLQTSVVEVVTLEVQVLVESREALQSYKVSNRGSSFLLSYKTAFKTFKIVVCRVGVGVVSC